MMDYGKTKKYLWDENQVIRPDTYTRTQQSLTPLCENR